MICNMLTFMCRQAGHQIWTCWKTGCYVYCPATEQHSSQQSGAQPGWGASEDVHDSTMITGADQRPVAAPLILMGIASVDKIPRYVYIMLHKVLCNMICNMSLYLCRAENVLGRVPMMLCLVAGNSKPTLPH
jgi:hypothetical protein